MTQDLIVIKCGDHLLKSWVVNMTALLGLLQPARSSLPVGRRWGLPVLARGVSLHAWGLRLRGVLRVLALALPSVWPSALLNGVGTPVAIISQLNAQPARAPVNASRAALRLPAHDSGSGWFATPFLRDSFIHNSTPIYPGALSSLLEDVLSDGPMKRRCQRTGKYLSALACDDGRLPTPSIAITSAGWYDYLTR